jgi:hypothetical protein
MQGSTRFTLALLGAAALAGCSGGGGGSGAGAGVVDTTPPSVVSTTPASGATGVAAGATISIEFSEPMDVATVTVTLTPTTSLGSPAWSAGNKVVTFTPPTPLVPGTSYAAAILGRDLAGNLLPTAGWGFSVAAALVLNNWDVASWDQGTWQ